MRCVIDFIAMDDFVTYWLFTHVGRAVLTVHLNNNKCFISFGWYFLHYDSGLQIAITIYKMIQSPTVNRPAVLNMKSLRSSSSSAI